jgi:hypothetical protein
MYTEIVSIHDIARLREFVDKDKKYFKDEDLTKILATCSGMLDRAVVKCFLGIEQKAKELGNTDDKINARTALRRFEAGLIQV